MDNNKEFFNQLEKIILKNESRIIRANQHDLLIAKTKGLSNALVERLTFGEREIKSLLKRIKELSRFTSPVNEVMEKRKSADGLILKKVRVPIGKILVIFESRPEVMIDAALLCLISGNACFLKGGKEAARSNKILYKCLLAALRKTGQDEQKIKMIKNREAVYRMIGKTNLVDLVIARGSYPMVKSIKENSKVPVLAHAAGGARIYVDKSADLKKAVRIILNAKTSKPAACNSVDTILIDKKIPVSFYNKLKKELEKKGVLVYDEKEMIGRWDEEFLDLKIGINRVNGINEAINFIMKHTKHHTEGILATDKKVIDKFTNSIDAAAIFINASTRLHDGGVFGMGAEMGIATGRLHARGPVGLKELTTYKWIIYGSCQIRK